MRVWPALLPLVLLAGCASPEARVRAALVDAGLAEPVAACMAERLVERLSSGQLRRLGELGKLRDRRPDTLSVAEFLDRARALGDAEILGVVGSSGLICAAGVS